MFFVAIYILTKMPGFKTLMSIAHSNQSFVSFTVSINDDVMFLNGCMRPGVLSDQCFNHYVFYFTPLSHPPQKYYFLFLSWNLKPCCWGILLLNFWALKYLSMKPTKWGDGVEMCIARPARSQCTLPWSKNALSWKVFTVSLSKHFLFIYPISLAEVKPVDTEQTQKMSLSVAKVEDGWNVRLGFLMVSASRACCMKLSWRGSI